MKKPAFIFTALTFAMIIAISFSFTVKPARASPDYTIEQVSHRVQVLYNGYLFVNDTIQISGDPPTEFLIGFPYIYTPFVLRVIAYNSTTTYPVTLQVPFEGRAGYYAAKVDFSSGAPQKFTVGFVLSNNLLSQSSQNTTLFQLFFPQYPSLTKQVANCTGFIAVPEGAEILGGTVTTFSYSRLNLPAFTYEPANVTLSITSDKIQKIHIREMIRELTINEFGEVEGSDTYVVVNEGTKSMTVADVALPYNISDVSAQDQFGRSMTAPTVVDSSTSRYHIVFTLPIDTTHSDQFTIAYTLPSIVHNKPQEGTNNFAFNITMFQNLIYYIDHTFVTLNLPEGARITDLEGLSSSEFYSVSKSTYVEAVGISKNGILSIDYFNLDLAYDYNPFWLSFRPTLITWIVATLGCVVVAMLKMPKAPSKLTLPSGAVKLRPENLKALVDAYEEKMKIMRELDSLEAKVQKGRIPRRRYKVQRKTLETRLASLSRNLADLKGKMRSTGGIYSEFMLQLEVAESELNEVENAVKSIESLHNRGELSLEAYRKRLDDYQHRKEKTETTINGILIRLREEIR